MRRARQFSEAAGIRRERSERIDFSPDRRSLPSSSSSSTMFADLKQSAKPETPKQCATRHGTAIDEISGILDC